MTQPNNEGAEPETITVSMPGAAQTIIDILQDQYGVLDGGELRAQLESAAAEIWSSAEFSQLFETVSIHAPYINVVRKQDGVPGTVMFVDSPRLYFSFNAGVTQNDTGTA